jgi:hypothetical protein
VTRSEAATSVCAGDVLNLLIWANVVAMLAVGLWIGAQLCSPSRLFRLRNALYARRATAADFDWKPANVPAEFRQETGNAPAPFKDAVMRLNTSGCASDWQRALRIAEHLTMVARDLGPIRSDLETTYARIQAGYGYCADFVKVFLGLAYVSGIFARQWSFSFNGFGGFGHTVVEVFDRSADKWLFLDVYNNIHVCDAATSAPMGALAFREALLHASPAIKIARNGTGRLGYPIEDKLLAYYRRGLQEWYLVCGNAVFLFEAHPLVRWFSRISGPAGQLVAGCLGKQPAIQLLATPQNVVAINALIALARRFRVAIILFMVLVVTLMAQAISSGLMSLYW